MNDTYLSARLPDELPNDPMHWVEAWLVDATEKAVKRNPNSIAVVTVGKDGLPSARMVLCKEFQADPGYLVFYTNYESSKARQIEENPNVAVLIHWDQLGRQVRTEGQAVRSPAAESDAYFATRDWGSQIGAWASDQSAPLESREALIEKVKEYEARFEGREVPRPPHWTGYALSPETVEFWTQREFRLHDRILYSQQDGRWVKQRLNP